MLWLHTARYKTKKEEGKNGEHACGRGKTLIPGINVGSIISSTHLPRSPAFNKVAAAKTKSPRRRTISLKHGKSSGIM